VLFCYDGYCFWSYVADSIGCLMLVRDGFCFLRCYIRIFVVLLFFGYLLGCDCVAPAGVVLCLVVLLGMDWAIVAIDGHLYSFTY
jgi:hypothetical protein